MQENPSVSVPDPKVALTLEQLSACQHLASRNITFSMTLACPLKCRHCIVDAGPEKKATTMPLEIAQRYAAEMPALAQAGILGISFTGGEPLLACQQVMVMSEAAVAVGIETSVVTAAHWSSSQILAEETVQRFDSIDCWDLSFDLYHLEWVSLENIKYAHKAISTAGKKLNLRFSYNDPPSDEELQILSELRTLDGAQCVAQRVRAVGRAKELNIISSERYNPLMKPCLTQGLVVRYDGTVAPCCLNLVESRTHPFQFGDTHTQSLVAIHSAFMRNPLLQLIRSVGFGQLRDWLVEGGLVSRLPEPMPDEVCELCEVILQDKEIATYLVHKAEDPENQLKIAVLASRLLGEDTMLKSLMDRGPLDSGAEVDRSIAATLLERPHASTSS